MFRLGDRFSPSPIMKVLAYNFRAIIATALQVNTFPNLSVKILEQYAEYYAEYIQGLQ